MVKGRPLLRWAGILLVFASISFVGIEARGGNEPAPPPGAGRPDLIKIDTLAAFGRLELPPVTFFHDKHTDALLKENKSCETCHAVEDKKLSFAFQRKKTTKPTEIKDIYHTGCIGCHKDMDTAGKNSGPLDGFCRSCHNAEPPKAARLDLGLDKVLHFRHVNSKQIAAPAGETDNCAACHHSYDQKAKKTFYAKGKEDNCRTCHGVQPQDGVLSLEQASHQQCVLCHLDQAKRGIKGQDNGPYVCAGCHGADGVLRVAKRNHAVVAKLPNKEVPRLLRGQPDAALITYSVAPNQDKGVKPLLMNPVAFDHKAHEKYSDSCRVCHHAGMESCDKCHTLAGAKEGKFVTFEQAMHSKTSNHSCIGCHNAKQAAANCAGCHQRLDQARRPDDASCRPCHLPGAEGYGRLGAGMVASSQQKSGVAASLLKSRNLNPGTYPLEDIPDKVVIKTLSDKYEPVELNHRQHVQKLLQGMKDNRLAAYFHRDPGTICQGCHHNSPPSKEPPRCVNCHPVQAGAKETNRPILLAAQHGQCMSCHKDMGLEKPAATACIQCHQEKQK
jgi:hypothetical protein